MDAKISVIVPVYNVEQYLPCCLRSIERQTIFNQLEVILVDDGSPDNSGRLCDEFAQKHENVRVIHKPNGGQAEARNCALDVATGEYFLFLDSDDFLREDACGYLLENAQRSGVDIVVFPLQPVFTEDEPVKPSLYEPFLIGDNRELFCALADRDKGVIELVCDKMFRRELFDGLRFPVGVRSEDTFLIPSLIARARSALVVGEMLYFYRQRAGSTMHTRGDTMVDERMAAHEEIVRVAREQYPEALEKAKAVTYFIHIRCMNSILDCPNFREHPCWERHIAKFRANLGDLLKTRSRKWLPLRRKAYAILLCACPELAMVYERVRFYKRRRHLVYKEFKKEAQSE